MTARHYETPTAFKQALEQRLRTASASGTDLSRRRQLLVFDRFLARVTRTVGDAVTLKGGLVLELRLSRARTTRDVDLRIVGSSREILSRLQEAGRLDINDFMRFQVELDRHHPAIRSEGMTYDGFRFRTECRLAGKLYGRTFGVDVAFGDPLVGEPDVVVAPDMLAFAGIAPPKLRLYPVVSHIAEKLHAYTMPRSRPNSRVKDLPDIPLLAGTGAIDGMQLRLALERTFSFRATHELPDALPEPPSFWEAPYEAMAKADDLSWATLHNVHQVAATFLDPALGRGGLGHWDPIRWEWNDGPGSGTP